MLDTLLLAQFNTCFDKFLLFGYLPLSHSPLIYERNSGPVNLHADSKNIFCSYFSSQLLIINFYEYGILVFHQMISKTYSYTVLLSYVFGAKKPVTEKIQCIQKEC